MIYYIAVFVTIIFLTQYIRFILQINSINEFDQNEELIETHETSFSGFFTTKGLINFSLGFFWSIWWINPNKDNIILSIFISIGFGVFGFINLSFLYFITKILLESERIEIGLNLVGEEVSISQDLGEKWYLVYIVKNNSIHQIHALNTNSKIFKPGEKAIIKEYCSGIYYI